jgi:hypothetical protein
MTDYSSTEGLFSPSTLQPGAGWVPFDTPPTAWSSYGWTGMPTTTATGSGGGGPVPPPKVGQIWPRGVAPRS